MTTPTHTLVEHFFRHEYGRLVAQLTRAIGVAHLELVEDVVQAALLQALQTWSRRGVPNDPAAWLYRVARNAATDALRRDSRWAAVRATLATESVASTLPHPPEQLEDDQLRLLFACCHPALPRPSQVALALKTLCGFSTQEIAHGLLTTHANIEKRLQRAKEKLRELDFDPAEVEPEHLAERQEAVRGVVYLLFNEGYHSFQSTMLIRRDLCDEALRLGRLLASHPATGEPATFALLALLLFHAARFDARIVGTGQLLLEEQDRTKWNGPLLAEGFYWFAQSAAGAVLSPYHLEAGIVSKHVAAPSFANTDWAEIVRLYDLLLQVAPSPLHVLNRAVALAHAASPQVALAELERFPTSELPHDYYLWPAVLGELYRRSGAWEQAHVQLTRASQLVTVPAERALLIQRLRACEATLSHALPRSPQTIPAEAE